MRLLLDTHVLLWFAAEPAKLASRARAAIENPENTVLVSAVSAWEIAIKQSLGRLRLGADIGKLVSGTDFDPLSITMEHAVHVAELPPHHHDPFDRLLISQAVVEGLTLVTRDRKFTAYPVALLPA